METITTDEISNILKETLPKQTFIYVQNCKGCFGDNYIKIAFAVSDFNINGVSGQKPQIVSLNLSLEDLELRPQCFGGNGGQRIYRKPNLKDPKEKYLAMAGIKIPFKQPKKEKKFVIAAIKRFAENWLNAIKENQNELMYSNYVDYSNFLNN